MRVGGIGDAHVLFKKLVSGSETLVGQRNARELRRVSRAAGQIFLFAFLIRVLVTWKP